VQIGKSPELQLPLRSFPELGEQIWGLVLPTRPDGSEPVLMSTSSEQGPVQVFDADGSLLGNLRPGGSSAEIKGLPLRVADIMPASGLLLKRDPGVPLVYAGFAITLLGGGLSLIATRQLWAVLDPAPFQPSNRKLHIGGLCNRNLAGFAAELPILISRVDGSRD
jgi:cytochrome c biogenesis protein